MSTISEPPFNHTTIERYHPRTQVIRGCAKGARWELWLRRPPEAFAGLVKGLWAGDADTIEARHRQLPNGELWLMFNLGPPQRILAQDRVGREQIVSTANIMGLQDQPYVIESVIGHPCVVVVRFLPRGAWAFFRGLPLAELANQAHDLESVMGASAGVKPLRERLLHRAHLGEALDILEEWLWAHLVAGPEAHSVTQHALDNMAAESSTLRVETLARDLGVSSRYMNDLFRREVGLSAKSLARILRFERAQDLLIASGDRDLASIAQACGYYDQSHLNRDFRELADLTPTEYLARVFIAPGWREIGG